MINPLKRVWRWVTGRVRESDGYPVNPYPAYFRPGDAEKRDFFAMILEVDRYERRRGGTLRERLSDERVVVLARSLEKYNPFCRSILSGLRSYVLGRSGLQVLCVAKDKSDDPDVAVAQAFLDKVRDRNNWWAREREGYNRAHRDGEVFFRLGVDGDGEITIRFIEPEFVRSDGTVDFDQGVRVDPDDAETAQEYAVEYRLGQFDYVDASEVYHVKLNVDAILRRGVSDFAATAKILDQSLVAVRNMISAEAFRQGNAWVTQHAEGTERGAVQNVQGGVIPTFNGYTDENGEELLTQVTEGVSVMHISRGQELAGTPGGESINGCIAAVNQSLQASVAQYRMPLSVVTGDTSRNNAIDMGSDHPFSTYVQDEQALFGKHWHCLFWKVLQWGVEEGLVPASVLEKVDIVVSAQQAATRDQKAATDRLKSLEDDDIISKQKRTELEGFDFDEQQSQIKKERVSGIETDGPSLPKSRHPDPAGAAPPGARPALNGASNGSSFHAN